MITSCLSPSVYQAPSDSAGTPPQAPQTRWESSLRGRAEGTRSSPEQGTPTSGQMGYSGPPRPPPFILTVRREKEARAIPSPGRCCQRARAEGSRGTVDSSPRGHSRAGTKHGSPLRPGAAETEAAIPTQPETLLWNQPATERTGCMTGHGGGPPTSRTAQDHHPLQDLSSRARSGGPG